MTSDEVGRITTERLARWGSRCRECHSTPYLLLAFGHDHVSGRPLLVALEDASDDDIFDALYGVLVQLQLERVAMLRRRPRRKGGDS